MERTEDNKGETHTAFTVENVASVEEVFKKDDEICPYFLKIFFIKSFSQSDPEV